MYFKKQTGERVLSSGKCLLGWGVDLDMGMDSSKVFLRFDRDCGSQWF